MSSSANNPDPVGDTDFFAPALEAKFEDEPIHLIGPNPVLRDLADLLFFSRYRGRGFLRAVALVRHSGGRRPFPYFKSERRGSLLAQSVLRDIGIAGLRRSRKISPSGRREEGERAETRWVLRRGVTLRPMQ